MAVRNRKMKYTVREVVLLCALLCVLAVHVWTVRTRPRTPCNTVLDSENVLLHESRMKRTVVGNHEVVYELPIGFVKTQTGFYKLGTVLAFHGCNHHATDFWDRSNECPECLGRYGFVLVGSLAICVELHVYVLGMEMMWAFTCYCAYECL